MEVVSQSSLRRLLGGAIPDHLADLDFLARADCELKVVGGLKDHNDGAAEAEATHLVTLDQRLSVEDRGCARVDSLSVCACRVVATLANVRAERLGTPVSYGWHVV